MNQDQLFMVPAHATLQAAFAPLTAAQDYPAPQQVMGIAVLFAEVCQVLRLDPSQMLDSAARVRRHAQDHYSLELKSLHNYINEELNK